MKRLSKSRQKLIINRIKKPSTPPKPILQLITGSSLIRQELLLPKDLNTLKPTNSSIFRKKS